MATHPAWFDSGTSRVYLMLWFTPLHQGMCECAQLGRVHKVADWGDGRLRTRGAAATKNGVGRCTWHSYPLER